MQVISPSLKAAVSLVSSVEELATVAATVALAGSIASAVGSAVLAPLLIEWSNMTVLLAICGTLYLIGAVLAAKLPREQTAKSLREAVGGVDWKPVALSRRNTADWLWHNRPIAVVILVGSVVFALFEAFNTLIPVYVRDVLHANPTNAVYIFAPAGIGFLFATLGTPVLVRKIGPRKLAVVAAGIMAVSMIGFALIGILAPILAPISPLRILGWLFNRDINDRVLAASTIAVPANFGSTAAGAAVQNYINAKVPLVRQGATFGVQEVQDNVFTLLIVLSLGAVSEFVGPKAVFFVAPMVAFLLVAGLIKYSYRAAGNQTITIRSAMDKLIQGYDDPPDADNRPQAEMDTESESRDKVGSGTST
ncbi:MAG TPA: MFS transporter, partial [Thermomicrobiales bacterium]|nr:MFS transporter [Thermomicrobiales bacterium]